MSSISLKLGVDIDGTFILKEDIQKMSFDDVKMVLSFLDKDDLIKAAAWHSETAQQYAEEILHSCNYKVG